MIEKKTGENASDLYGGSVAGIGDVDGDNVPDFMVGAPGYNSNMGKAYVYSGTSRSLLYGFEGQSTVNYTDVGFGAPVSGVGDVNNDGKPDFGIGSFQATYNGVDQVGKAYIYISQ